MSSLSLNNAIANVLGIPKNTLLNFSVYKIRIIASFVRFRIRMTSKVHQKAPSFGINNNVTYQIIIILIEKKKLFIMGTEKVIEFVAF